MTQDKLKGKHIHYKWVTISDQLELVGRRIVKNTVRLANDQWRYLEHEMTLASSDNNVLANPAYKLINFWHANPTTQLKFNIASMGRHVELSCVASIKGGSNLHSMVVVELSADEFRKIEKKEEYYSDLTPVEGNRFSVILPLESLMSPAGSATTTAALNVIHGSNVRSYDPYTFKEDEILLLESSLPRANDKVEFLYRFKFDKSIN